MRAEEVTVKPALHNEFRAMTNGLAAFSTATVLVFLQGSFGELDSSSNMALFFFTAAIPMCIAASFISFLFSQRSRIPAWADSFLDLIMGAGWVGAIVGFGALLFSANLLLGTTYVISIGVAFLGFVFLVYGIGKSDSRRPVEECAAKVEDYPGSDPVEAKEV